jgi:predicted Zn-dependent protease
VPEGAQDAVTCPEFIGYTIRMSHLHAAWRSGLGVAAAALTACATSSPPPATVSEWAAHHGIRAELLEELRASPAAEPLGLHCTEAIHGDPERAYAELAERTAPEQSPDATLLFCHAFAAIATRRYEPAYSSAIKLVAADPKDALAQRLLSFAALRTGRYAEAADAAKQAEALVPNMESAELMGKAMLRAGEPDEALSALRLWASRGGGVEARCWIAAASWRAGLRDAALLDLDLLAADNPRDPEPLVWKASMLWSGGDRVGAWRASDDAMARAPDVPQVVGQRLRMAMDAGDRDQAQAMLDRLAQSSPEAARKLAGKLGLRY